MINGIHVYLGAFNEVENKITLLPIIIKFVTHYNARRTGQQYTLIN